MIQDAVSPALGESVRAAERSEHVDRAVSQRFAAATEDLTGDEVMTVVWR